VRVRPYLRGLPLTATAPLPASGTGVVRSVFGRTLARAAQAVERVLGGTTSVRRRLARAGIDQEVHDFRVQQVVWGLCGFAAAASLAVLQSVRNPSNPVGLLLMCGAAFCAGVILCDNRLTARVRARER